MLIPAVVERWVVSVQTHGGSSRSTGDAPAHRLGLDPSARMENNAAYTLCARLGDLIKTGPTGTNVNDIRIIYRGRTDQTTANS